MQVQSVVTPSEWFRRCVFAIALAAGAMIIEDLLPWNHGNPENAITGFCLLIFGFSVCAKPSLAKRMGLAISVGVLTAHLVHDHCSPGGTLFGTQMREHDLPGIFAGIAAFALPKSPHPAHETESIPSPLEAGETQM